MSDSGPVPLPDFLVKAADTVSGRGGTVPLGEVCTRLGIDPDRVRRESDGALDDGE